MIDLNILSCLAKNEVIKHLQFFYGDKDIVIESSMMKFLERIVGVKFLRSQGVKKIFRLESNLVSTENQIVYFVPPVISVVKTIVEHIKVDKKSSIIRNYIILFYPSRTFVIDCLMEQECMISENIIIENLNLHFIPLESNLISYEQKFYFRDLFIEKSKYPLEYITTSLVILMKLYGLISLVYSIGDWANELSEMLKFSVVSGDFDPNNTNPMIGRLIIIDRNIDMVTPCLSQITYEGMLSDVFGIVSGYLEIKDKDLLKKLPPNSSKILLNDKNLLYGQIRDMQLTDVFQYLKEELNNLHQIQAKSSKITNVSDMKQFVSNDLKLLQAKRACILTHISCGEALMYHKERENFSNRLLNEYEIIKGKSNRSIQEYIENIIIAQESVQKCLCLIVLWCRCSNPTQKNLEHIKNLFYQSYGYKHIITFENLVKCGIIRVNYYNSYEKISQELDLIPSNPDQCYYPLDMGSVYNGNYRPLSCRIIESILNPYTVESFKSTSIGSKQKEFQFLPFKNIGKEAQETVMILFLGGVNHSELSSIKTIGINLGLRLVVATTSVINGIELMDMLQD